MNAYYNEINPKKAAVLRELIRRDVIAPGDVDERDIRDIVPNELARYTQCHFFAGIGVWSYALRLAGVSDDEFVWTGSCPCQPFSAAGRRKGFADERHLWPAFHWLIEQSKPRVVYGEQVAGKDGLAWFDHVLHDLEASGYSVRAADIPAAGFGAPHKRQRLYFVADTSHIGHERVWGTRRRRPGPADVGDSRNVEHTESNGRNERRAEPVGRGVTSGRGPSIVDNSDHEGRFRSISVPAGRQDEAEPDAARAGPTNGFWADVEWIFCRDGKWRPTEPRLVKVSDGAPGRILHGNNHCIHGDEETPEAEVDASSPQARSNSVLQALREPNEKETVRSSPRMPACVREEKVLRPGVYGEGVFRDDQTDEPEELAETVGPNGERGLRDVRERRRALCSPRRPEPVQQRPLEFEDVVRLLPQAITLAKLERDRRTEESLSVLLAARAPEGFVLDAPDAVQTLWRSIGEEGQTRLFLDLVNHGFGVIGVSPLSVGAEARVLRLRCYGDAIVAPQAAAFIEATKDG